MNNYKNKYIKYKLKYLKLKQTGGVCLGRGCFPAKDNVEEKEQEDEEEQEEENEKEDIIIAKGVIYVDGGDPRSYDLFIDKNKTIMHNIDKFFKDFKDDEIKYFYELDKIMYAGIELTNESDLSFVDMEDEAVINIHLKLRKIKCNICEQEDKITSNDYIYSHENKVYVHHSINKCYNYIEKKEYNTTADKKNAINKILRQHGKIAPGYSDTMMFSYYNPLDREKKNKYAKIIVN